jgi:hypothetical protein
MRQTTKRREKHKKKKKLQNHMDNLFGIKKTSTKTSRGKKNPNKLLLQVLKECQELKEEILNLKKGMEEKNLKNNLTIKKEDNNSTLQEINEEVQEITQEPIKKDKDDHSKSKPIQASKASKEQIMEEICLIIEEEKLRVSQLKELIVDERQLCSKASFYRYIEVLKRKKKLSIIKSGNKEIILTIKE